MRIGTKLLLTYAILIGVVTLAALAGLPRWVEGAVVRAENERLEKQAQILAEDLGNRFRSRRPSNVAGILTTLENYLVDDAIALVHTPTSRVVLSARRPELERLAPEAVDRLCQPPQTRRMIIRRSAETPGLLAAWACAEIPGVDYTLMVFRDLEYIKNVGRPITVRIYGVIALVLLISLIAIGWLSRDMVRRLRSTGVAARALAEGDLTRRAPERGSDEIADLAGHFNHMAERIEKLVGGLRRSEHLRKELLVTVSHELRTPLTSIAGFAEALRDGVVKDEQQRERYFQIIAGESARLNRLINDVFDVARLEAGQMEIRLQAVPVAAWLVDVLEGFQPVAEGAGARLELELAPEAEPARIYGDRDRLEQVMNNLLSNAVRYTPSGEAITIRARVDGPDIVFEVADRGPGLQPEEAEKVFERFWQGANKGIGHKGAGLGLAIVKSLVEAHGGTVGVTSTPGEGAAFWFRLKQVQG